MTKIFTPFCRSRRADSKYIYFVGSHKVFFNYNYIIGGKSPKIDRNNNKKQFFIMLFSNNVPWASLGPTWGRCASWWCWGSCRVCWGARRRLTRECAASSGTAPARCWSAPPTASTGCSRWPLALRRRVWLSLAGRFLGVWFPTGFEINWEKVIKQGL